MSDPRPVGLFDSGIGGVTVLREIRAQLPRERCVYLGDTGNGPYGTRDAVWVRDRCRQMVDFLLDQDCKAIVVACNTATVIALADLRARYRIPFIGIEPAVKPAAARSRTGTIGVLATPMTLASDSLGALIARHARGTRVVVEACPDLVELIEQGIADGPAAEACLRPHVEALRGSGVDVIALACTHFPLAMPLLERLAGPEVSLIDPAEAVARQLGRVLEAEGLTSREVAAPTRFFVTGDPGLFMDIHLRLIGPLAEPVEVAEPRLADRLAESPL
jgi:glutamate racemase